MDSVSILTWIMVFTKEVYLWVLGADSMPWSKKCIRNIRKCFGILLSTHRWTLSPLLAQRWQQSHSVACLPVPPTWESLVESDVPVSWGSTGRKLCGLTRRRKFGNCSTVFPDYCFARLAKGLLSRFCGRRTTRRLIWVPSTSAILSEALQSLQQKCFEVVGFGLW